MWRLCLRGQAGHKVNKLNCPISGVEIPVRQQNKSHSNDNPVLLLKVIY